MKNAITVLFLILSSSLTALPHPYEGIHLLPPYPFGYYAHKEIIEEIFNEEDINVVVEIGSWIGGGSTRHFGELLKERNGTLYAVDTWLGNLSQQPRGPHYQPILNRVYHQFLSNMVHWDLTKVVVPCRMKSTEAALMLNIKPDLVYIDGERTTDAVYEDLVTWYPFVKDTGVLCGDDYDWDSVRAAVDHFATENNLYVEIIGNFWRLF